MKALVVLMPRCCARNAYVYLHVHSHHLGMVITKVRRSVPMLNNAMGMTDDRSTKVGHYVATIDITHCV